MLYFIVVLSLVRGPVIDSDHVLVLPAARLFALYERSAGCMVKRETPDLDYVPVRFREQRSTLNPDLIENVLQAHGLYLHQSGQSAGAPVVIASRKHVLKTDNTDEKCVEVYRPNYVSSADLVRAVNKAQGTESVTYHPGPFQQRIVVKASDRAALKDAVKRLEEIDRPRKRDPLYHSYYCRTMFVSDVHRELIRLLSRAVRDRVRIVAFRPRNTLLVACGSDDWETIRGCLESIDPVRR